MNRTLRSCLVGWLYGLGIVRALGAFVRVPWLLLLLLLLPCLHHCQSGSVCEQGQSQPCHCLGPSVPRQGTQQCAPTGAHWLGCVCPSTTPDASPDTQEPTAPSEPIAPQPEPVLFDSGPDQPVLFEPAQPDASSGPEWVPERVSAPTLRVDQWFRGAKAAVSLTVDEGVASPYTLLAPVIEHRGWRATYYVFTLQPYQEKTWDVIKAAHKRGHEISCHTHTHPNLTKINIQRLHEEMKQCIAELKKQVAADLLLLSFAYPFEASDARVWSVVKQYHRYARGGDQGAPVPPNPVPLNDAKKPDFSFLQAKAPTRSYTVPQWNSWVDAAVKQGKWLIEELHGIEKEGWEPRTTDEYEAHFDHIERFGAKVWVGRVCDVGRYIEQRKSLTLKWAERSSSELSFTPQDNLPAGSYRVPLSFVLQVPATWGWKKIKVVQQGKKMRVTTLGPGMFRLQSLSNGASVRVVPE